MTTDGGSDAEPEAAAFLNEEEADLLIRSVSSIALFGVLKNVEFILPLRRVFAGFQVKPEGLKNPLTHRRLITELINNSALADALRDLSRAPMEAPPTRKPPPLPKPTPTQKSDREERLIVERDRLKREFREAQAALREQTHLQTEAGKQIAQLQESRAALKGELTSEQSQSVWLKKRLHRQERELADAKAAARKILEQSPQELAVAAEGGVKSAEPNFERSAGSDTVVRSLERLLSRGQVAAVDLVTEEMLRENGKDLAARRVRVLVRIAQGSKAAAMDDLRYIFEAQLNGGDIVAALRSLLQSIAVTGTPDRKMTTLLYARLSQNLGLVRQAAGILLPLRGSEAYAALRDACKPPLVGKLFAEPGSSLASGMLPPPLRHAIGEDVTPLRLIHAMDSGDESTVSVARAAAQQLDKANRDLLDLAISDIADTSYYTLLTRRELAGPAIVDMSNVANYERELMAANRPLLANVLAVRSALLERGYFPITLIGDANLPYLIDRSDKLRQMAASEEAKFVTSGTDADEIIVREARRTGAVVVTNDYMIDWDPEGEIEKVQYSISLTDGKATLYF